MDLVATQDGSTHAFSITIRPSIYYTQGPARCGHFFFSMESAGIKPAFAAAAAPERLFIIARSERFLILAGQKARGPESIRLVSGSSENDM
jgi:hypothetical protein